MSAVPAWIAENPSSSCMNSGSRNVSDSSIANMIDPTTVPERNAGSLNRRKSTAGTGAVSSRITQAASATAASIDSPVMRLLWNQ